MVTESSCKLKLLTNKQKKEASDLFKYYNHLFICNECGSVYGSDNMDVEKICVVCENKRTAKKRQEKKDEI